ncbi:MAG: YkgJ family cysteine cluster protein [Gemmatimonadota bacterium]
MLDREHLDRCKACKAACCRYISVLIAPPEDEVDFDNLRWYLAHEGVSVFQDEDGDWMVSVPTRCRFLSRRYTCKIYDERPAACRGYDPALCEFGDQPMDYGEYLESVEDLDTYRGRTARAGRRRRGGRP